MMLVVLLVHFSENELPVKEIGDTVHATQNSVV